jgi:hypothetical protein
MDHFVMDADQPRKGSTDKLARLIPSANAFAVLSPAQPG